MCGYLQMAHCDRLIGNGEELGLYGIWHRLQLYRGLPSSELSQYTHVHETLVIDSWMFIKLLNLPLYNKHSKQNSENTEKELDLKSSVEKQCGG